MLEFNVTFLTSMQLFLMIEVYRTVFALPTWGDIRKFQVLIRYTLVRNSILLHLLSIFDWQIQFMVLAPEKAGCLIGTSNIK